MIYFRNVIAIKPRTAIVIQVLSVVSLSQGNEGVPANHQQNGLVTGELEQLRSELRMETEKMNRQMAQMKQEMELQMEQNMEQKMELKMEQRLEQMKQEMELKNKQEINQLQLDLDLTRTENSKINNEVYISIYIYS